MLLSEKLLNLGPFWAGVLLMNEQNIASRNIAFLGCSLILHSVV